MRALEVSGLRKDFVTKRGPLFHRRKETVSAVDGVSFAIDSGEIFSLLGPNGAGKTTCIKMLATLLIPTSGTARVFGLDVVRDEMEVRRRITAVSATRARPYCSPRTTCTRPMSFPTAWRS